MSSPSHTTLREKDWMLGGAGVVAGLHGETLQCLVTGTDDKAVWASPVYSALWSEDLTGMPPLYISVGGHEILRDEAVEFGRKVQQQPGAVVAVVEGPGLCHIYPLFADWVPEAQAALDGVTAWAEQQLSLATPAMVSDVLRRSLLASKALR